MSGGHISANQLITALARSQKLSLAIARAVYQLANGDADAARDSLEEVAELAKEAQWTLSEIALDAGLVDRG